MPSLSCSVFSHSVFCSGPIQSTKTRMKRIVPTLQPTHTYTQCSVHCAGSEREMSEQTLTITLIMIIQIKLYSVLLQLFPLHLLIPFLLPFPPPPSIIGVSFYAQIILWSYIAANICLVEPNNQGNQLFQSTLNIVIHGKYNKYKNLQNVN